MSAIQGKVESFEIIQGFSEQFAMTQALERLKAVFPDADNLISFEVTHYGRQNITKPCFYANSTSSPLFTEASSTPNDAVNNFLKSACITRVEEFIRTKDYMAGKVKE